MSACIVLSFACFAAAASGSKLSTPTLSTNSSGAVLISPDAVTETVRGGGGAAVA